MKKLLFTIAIAFVSNLVLAQTTNTNNVQSTSYQEPVQDETEISNLSDDQKTETITYYDGLGRPLQSIAKQAGGERQDIVTPIVYDAIGRQAKDYLPYVDATQTTGANLNLRATSTLLTDIDTYYTGKHPDDMGVTPNPYSEKSFEASPLNRILEQGAPGEDWLINTSSDSDHTIKMDYQSNTLDLSSSQSPGDNVMHYQVIFPTTNTEEPLLFYNGYYNENELYKSVIKDENWTTISNKNRTTEEFKNKQGQVVLKRTFNNDIHHDTYYVYDDYGNLTYVLSPKGSNEILSTNTYSGFNQAIKASEFIPTDSKGNPIAIGTDGVNVTLDAVNNTLTVDFDMTFTPAIDLIEGPIALLDEYVPDMIIGTVANGNYTVSIHGGFLYLSGTGLVSSISDNFTLNLPVFTVDTDVLDDLGYQYHYDHRNRLIEKKIPGKDWEYIVYDKLDRPVATQDALLKAADHWLFTKYDAFGRVAYAGKVLHTGATRLSLQTTLDSETVLYDTRVSNYTTIGGGDLYYNNLSYPQTGVVDVYTINYYDDYSNLGLATTFNYDNSYNQTQSTNNKGLSTVSKVRVLETTDWITTVTYYDDKARPIYTVSENEYLDTVDKIKSNLDFVGRVVETEISHVKGTNDAIVTTDVFTYDHTGRLLSQKQQINDLIPELIAKNYYDELGQLEKKDVGGETIFDGYIDIVNVSYNSNTDMITKDGGVHGAWDAGLATKGKFHGNGFVEATVELGTKNIMIGLSEINTDEHWNTMDFAIFAKWDGDVKVYEGGSNLGTFSTYVPGDILRVERTGTTITYKKNGQVIYTSLTSSTGSLLGDLSMFHNGAQVSNFKIESTNLNTILQTVDYKYNIRGWLKGINDVADLTTNEDLFAFKLNYNTQDYIDLPSVDPVNGRDLRLYNGNISETAWNSVSEWTPPGTSTSESEIIRAYTYVYDDLNRITEGLFSKASGVDHDGYFNLREVDYDRNGNIAVLRRSGYKESTNAWMNNMDNMAYTYKGNQLEDITENGNRYEGFANESRTQVGDYIYDANGNMVRDYNKRIGSSTADVDGIWYNHLNLPTLVRINNNVDKQISYIYDATGIKQKKVVTDGASNITTTEYAGNYIYEDGNLKFFSHPEGYTEKGQLKAPIGGGASYYEYDYIYQYKDHLGNIRLSYEDVNNDGAVSNTEVIEENNYYPFGLQMKGFNNQVSANYNGQASKYKTFQGQKLEDELDLNWYSFKYRNYDPAIGRFFNIDPLAEDYAYNSTYAFQENKLGMGIELEGAELLDFGIAQYLTGLFVNFENNVSGARSKISEAVENRKEALETGQEQNNAQIANINVNVVRDAGMISEGVSEIGSEAVNTTKQVIRDVADTAEVVGDGMVVAAPLTGPAAPITAGVGGTVSTVGTLTNIGLDLAEGDYESAGSRVFVEAISGGLSTAVKNTPHLTEQVKQIVDAKIVIYENFAIPKKEEKENND